MRDNTNLNKFSMIIRIIMHSIMILIGIAELIFTIVVLLGKLKVISLSLEIPENLNWFHFILSLIVSFAFILLPVKNIVGYCKRFKDKNFNKEVGTVTIASLETALNSVDVLKQHNNEIKNTGTSNQVNTVYNKSFLVFWGVMVGFFVSIAVLLLVLSFINPSNVQITSNGQSLDGKDLWKVSVFILLLLLPVILLFVYQLKKYYAIKNNKIMKPIPFVEYLIGLIVTGVLFVCPLLFIGENSEFNGVGAIVYLSFCGALFALILFGYMVSIIRHIKNTRIIEGKVPAIRYIARYVGCKFSSSSSTAINGVPTDLNVKFKVKFAYTDKYGNEVVKTSNEDYRYDEVVYLKYKQQFDIMVYKNSVIIVEDLSNTRVSGKVTVTVDQNETKSSLPYFAKNNRWLSTLIIGSIVFAVLEILGVLMLVNTQGSSFGGIVCVIMGILEITYVAFYSLPNVLAEKYGIQAEGKLIKLQIDHKRGTDYDSNRKYAVVEYNGIIKNIYILYDELYSILGTYVGQNIPLKVFRKTAVIDFKKIYSDKII